MPLIEVHLIENVFNSEQKRQIIEKLTDAMVSIEGENTRGVTWVILKGPVPAAGNMATLPQSRPAFSNEAGDVNRM